MLTTMRSPLVWPGTKDFILFFPTVVPDMEALDLVLVLNMETLDSDIQALVHVEPRVSVASGAAELWQGLHHADPKHNLGHDGVMIMTNQIFQTCLRNGGYISSSTFCVTRQQVGVILTCLSGLVVKFSSRQQIVPTIVMEGITFHFLPIQQPHVGDGQLSGLWGPLMLMSWIQTSSHMLQPSLLNCSMDWQTTSM